MNKTITANIGGINFHLDENAYEIFKSYLDNIRRSLGTTEGRDEIMQDIEARVAEMLQGSQTTPNQVITQKEIEMIMEAMGKPEDFTSGEQTSETKKQSDNIYSETSRKLFRDPDDKLLGGVCSGLSAYFNIDSVWFRLFFAFLFFGLGTGVLFYIILWIVIPEAKNSADKLRMRGQPVNLSNIEKNVREEMENLKERAERFAKEGRNNGGSFIRNFFNGLSQVIQFLFKAFVKLIAIFFLLLGLFVALAIFAALFGVVFHLPGVSVPVFFQSSFSGSGEFLWTIAGVALVVGIPFLMLALLGAKLLFNVKISRIVGFSTLAIWLIGIGLVLFLGLGALQEFKKEESVRSELTINDVAGRTLIVSATPSEDLESKYDEEDSDTDWDISMLDDKLVSAQVKLDVVKSPDNQYRLIELYYAKGSTSDIARENASKVVYSVLQQDTTLLLNRTFSMEKLEKFRQQRVQLILQIPVGESIYLDQTLKSMLFDVENVQNIYDHDMVNRTWKMTDDGLSCADCNGMESTVGSMSGDDASLINIDSNGIRVIGDEGEEIRIDSNGINIRKVR
ncbi:MAG: hypothetical protein RIQ47_1163 [Bacteroidota bacterium]|jgi:phage shock protein PspC (stress-responsive transcriptional regulator)